MTSPHKGGLLEAGKHAELAVTVLDQFGNVTADLAGHSIEATAQGPATVTFVETAAGVYRSPCPSLGIFHYLTCIGSAALLCTDAVSKNCSVHDAAYPPAPSRNR